MVRHPAFLVGLAASVASLTVRPGTEDWAGQGYYMATIAWTFLWMGTLVAGALVAGRQSYVSEADLFPATPATPADRVLGTALGLVGPALVAAVAVAAIGVLKFRSGFVLGDEGYSRTITPSLFEWAQPVLLVVLAGVVGIALAQLRRGRIAALLITVMAVFIGGTAAWAFQVHPLRVLHPFMYPSYELSLPESFTPDGWGPDSPPLTAPGEFSTTWHSIHLDPGALGWHLLYVGGLILLGVWISTRLADRGERTARTSWLGLTALALLVVGGITQIVTAGINRV